MATYPSSTSDPKIKFINCIRKYPGLYNPTEKNYRDRDYTAIAWEEIVNECHMPSVAKAKTMWGNLRRGYKDSLNNPKKKKTKYYNDLKFMFSFIQNNDCDDNDDEVQFIMKKERSDDDEIDRENLSERSSSSVMTKRRRNYSIDNRPSTSGRQSVLHDHEYPSSSYPSGSQQINQQDDLKIFLDSMYLMAKKLPLPLQRHVRNQIFEIIKDAESNTVIEQTE